MTLHVDIVSAEAAIFSGTATMVFAPAEMGEVGIAPRHTPLLSRLKPGEVRVQDEHGEEHTFFVNGGMLEVQPHVVTILSDSALRAKDLDEAAALQAKQEAEKTLAENKADIDYAKAQAELAEAVAQLRTIQKLKKSK
ncbi:ATP synthase epsilon chain [Thiohalobacter sp. COW1]|uniref:ATP synthase epsilon chain n=2 Tax=Thiohalobacteraceae TaxID=3085110 RepID=A0A1Z4VLZ4_9GAMM|nr:ATP synthase F1 subunit epsilon [Thiohalobacter thiocyanaticus]BCO32397.1 ATP synthase epsilon chain [Thiohalobacter sp. COW1]